MKKQIISKDNVVKCIRITTAPYSKDDIQSMRNAGYKVKEIPLNKHEAKKS